MSDLADTFGEEFADNVQNKIQEARAARERVDEATMQHICSLAVNEKKFHEGDPHFTYTDENGVTHDVMLVQVPDPENSSFWSLKNELESGAVSFPLDYLGEWMSSLFNDKEMAKELEPGEWYIAVGNMTENEADNGKTYTNLQPVRGIVDIGTAKGLAERGMEDEGFGSGEEDEDAESETSEGVFGGEDEEEESSDDELSEDEVVATLESIGEDEEEVWEIEDEDDSRLSTLSKVICNRLGLDADNQELRSEIESIALDRILQGSEDDDTSDEEENLF